MTVEPGTKWAAIQPYLVEDGELNPLPQEQVSEWLFVAQIGACRYAEREDVELDDETWQIIEQASITTADGETIKMRGEDENGEQLPAMNALRVEGVKR